MNAEPRRPRRPARPVAASLIGAIALLGAAGGVVAAASYQPTASHQAAPWPPPWVPKATVR